MASARNRRSDAESVIWPQVLLVVAVVALTLIGFVMIYSASQVTILSEAATNYYADTEAGQYLRDTISYSDYIAQQNPSAKLISQFVYSLAGIIIAVAIWFMLPRCGWKSAIVKGYWAVCVVLLAITFLFGAAALGAQRWIVIGPFSLQPSEFAKIAIVLMAANLMDDLNEGAEFKATMIRAAIYVVAPTLFLLFTQSDLGTTIIIFVGVYAVLWFGGAPAKLMLAIAGAAVVAIVAIVLFGSGYRQDRFVVYNPWNDGEGGRGNGYQTIHSFYAFAEGGLFGVGLGNSSEKYDYLPEAETDFVFSIIGEEFGMLGALVVIALFCCILFAGMRIARAAATPNERIVAGSVTIMLVFQAFLNMGCVIGLVPTTGKPLPFVSAGGSSLIASLMMVGIILAVSRNADATTVYDRRRANLRVVRAVDDDARGSRDVPRGRGRADSSTRAPQGARRRQTHSSSRR